MGLAKLVRKQKKGNSLVEGLYKTFRRDLVREPPLHDDWIRASSIAGICPREEVLCGVHEVKRDNKVSTDLNIIFAHGTALHWALQNEVLPALGSVFRGQWKCLNCATDHGKQPKTKEEVAESIVARPKLCGTCGGKELHFVEHYYRDTEYRVHGHPDGYLVLPDFPGPGIVECKSISQMGFWEVQQVPKVDHVLQAQTYMWLTGLKWAKILYWNKGGFKKDVFAEHTINRSERTIQKLQRAVLAIRNGLNEGKLPVRICETSTCPRAKSCPVKEQCFGK